VKTDKAYINDAMQNKRKTNSSVFDRQAGLGLESMASICESRRLEMKIAEGQTAVSHLLCGNINSKIGLRFSLFLLGIGSDHLSQFLNKIYGQMGR
jgi:hypothetical protein